MFGYRILSVVLALAAVSPAAGVDTLDVAASTTGGWTVFGARGSFLDLRPGDPCVDRDGSVWWGTGDGALRYDGKSWTKVTSRDGLMEGEVISIVQAGDGTLWFAGSHRGRVGVTRFDGTGWRIFSVADGLVGNRVGRAAAIDGRGGLWLATEHTDRTDGEGVMRFDGETWQNFRVKDGLAHNRVYDVAAGPDGSVWFGTHHGVSRFDGKSWTTTTPEEGLGAGKVYGILVARDGTVWCTHGEQGGVSVFDGTAWTPLTAADGMPVDEVRAITQTADGAIWLGTHVDDDARGLLRFKDGRWLRFLPRDGLPGTHVLSIAQAGDGSLWLLTHLAGVTRYRPDFTDLQTISGRLQRPEDGSARAHVGVRVEDEMGEARAGTVTDAEGRYRLVTFREAYRVSAVDSAGSGPEIAGIWQGLLKVSWIELRVVFKIFEKANGRLTATLDSPDQGVTDIPVDEVVFKGGRLRVEVKRVRGVFNGRFRKDGPRIEGEWKQGFRSLRLVLKRVDEAPRVQRPQEPKRPYPYREEEVVYENEEAGVRLAGTLTLPRSGGPFPAVLLISGSGPQNRDESLLGHRPFLVLADYLTRRGIAVLRVDDRGVGESTGEFSEATIEDFAGDALSGVAYLKGREEIDPGQIGLVGHSEGGVVAPLAATRSTDVAFTVLMAGTGLIGEEILHLQQALILKAMGATEALVALNRRFQGEVFAILRQEEEVAVVEERIRALEKRQVADLDPELRQEFRDLGLPDPEAGLEMALGQLLTAWFRYFLTYDPAPALKEVTCPVLAINGEKDLQVPPGENLGAIEAALKAGGNRDYTIRELPGLNHLFQTAETGSPAEYGKIEETFSPAALKVIGDWILTQTGRL